MKIRHLGLLLLGGLAAACGDPVGTVTGTVTFDRSATEAEDLSGSLVTLGERLMATAPDGTYRFDGVAPGAHLLRVTRDGMVPQEQTVEVAAEETVTVEFELAPPPVPNKWPTINNLDVDPPQLLASGTAAAIVSASDEDGDHLSYEWTATGGFKVSGKADGKALVTAPATFGTRGTLTVTVTDARGGWAKASMEVSTQPNNAPVLTSIVAAPSQTVPGGAIMLRALAADPEAAELTYAWSAPDGWTVEGNGFEVSLIAPATYGESGQVTVEIADPEGATVTGVVTVATVQNAAPIVSALTAQPQQTAPGGTVALEVLAHDPNGDSLTYDWTAPAGWTVVAQDDEATLTAPTQYGQSGLVTVEVADGHGGTVQAQILVSTSANRAPVLASLTAAPPTVAKGGTMTLAASAVDPDGDPLTYAWSAPQGWTLTPNGAEATLVAPAQPGFVGTVTLVVSDADGMSVQGAIVVSTLANNGPQVSAITAQPQQVAKGGTTSVTVSANDPDGDALSYVWSASSGWSVTGSGATAQVTAPSQPGQTGTINVVVTDATGAQVSSSVVVSTKENASPLISSVTATPASVAKGGTVQINAQASDADGDALTFAWTAPSGWSLTGSGAQVSLTAPATPGATGTLSLVVTDDFGGSAQHSLVVSTLANTAPVVASVTANPSAMAKGATSTVSVSAHDADGDDLTYAWQATGGFTVVGQGATAQVTAPSAPGANGIITVTVTDEEGAASTGTVAVSTHQNRAPVIASISPSPNTVNKGGTLQVTVSASDADGDALSYAFTAPASWTVTPNGNAATVVAPMQAGASATLVVQVTDSEGAVASGQVALSTFANNAPQLASLTASAPMANPGQVVALHASASDADGDALSYAWSVDVPGWTLSGSGASTSLTAPGTYSSSATVTVTITDGFGGQVVGSVPVQTRPTVAPTITTLPPTVQPAARQTFWSYDVNAQDADGDPLTYALQGAPASASIDPLTGVISWRPERTEEGAFGFTIIASDGSAQAAQYVSGEVQPFTLVRQETEGGQTNGFAAGDLDGDGLVDSVTLSFGGVATIFFTDGVTAGGKRSLEMDVSPIGASSCLGTAIEDVNVDGKPDLLFICGRYGTTVNGTFIFVHLNDGTGGFSLRGVFGNNSGINTFSPQLAMGDVNGDGLPDAVTLSTNGHFTVLYGDATGAFPNVLAQSRGGSWTNTLALADMTGDGLPDAISINTAEDIWITPFDAAGTAGLDIVNSLGAHGSFFYGTVPADLDGDGDLDLAVSSSTAPSGVRFFINDGTGLLTLGGNLEADCVGMTTSALALADMDGDGRKDFVIGSSSTTCSGLQIAFNEGGLNNWDLRTTVSTEGATTRFVHPVDWNGDGLMDVLTMGSGTVSVFH